MSQANAIHPAPADPRRRRRRALLATGVAAAVAVVFLAGVGSGMLILTNRMTDMVGGLAMSGQLPGGGGAPGGSDRPQLPGGEQPGGQPPLPGAPDAGGSGDPELQRWAEEQGLPAGVPEQILGQLQQQFPDGIPD
ncbi:MAG: hypothetical protein ACRCSN_21500, partial [Dermatophilaceae bacterium]